MDLDGVINEAEAVLEELTGRRSGRVPSHVSRRILSLPGRRPTWRLAVVGETWTRSPGHSTHALARAGTRGVAVYVLQPYAMEARGDLVSCAVLLAVELYDRSPRGRCPERLRALAAMVATMGHASVTRGP